MTDIANRLAGRLERLDNPLAIVLSIHLFVENLLDKLIEKESPIAKKILDDHRTYSFAVKLTLVFHMELIDRTLFDNLVALNGLRNRYAHDLDVELGKELAERKFVDRGNQPQFDPGDARGIANDARAAVQSLLKLRDCTFGWLHEVATQVD